MLWIIGLVVILFIIIVLNIEGKYEVATNNNSIRRTEIEINLKEYIGHYSFNTAGVHLQENAYAIFNICKEFDVVDLVPEPDNNYNSEAIKVIDSGWHFGYVPDYDLDEVHKIIQKDYIAYIETILVDGWIDVTVKIRYK